MGWGNGLLYLKNKYGGGGGGDGGGDVGKLSVKDGQLLVDLEEIGKLYFDQRACYWRG